MYLKQFFSIFMEHVLKNCSESLQKNSILRVLLHASIKFTLSPCKTPSENFTTFHSVVCTWTPNALLQRCIKPFTYTGKHPYTFTYSIIEIKEQKVVEFIIIKYLLL